MGSREAAGRHFLMARRYLHREASTHSGTAKLRLLGLTWQRQSGPARWGLMP